NQLFANAYLKLGADSVFDKPVIFIEGIDFGSGISGLQNGDFGWVEFRDPSPAWSFLENSIVLSDSLLDIGADIVLIDFFNGASSLFENKELVKRVIELCNEHKIGKHPNTLIGTSMGGVLGRMALREMELNGQRHCTGTFISHDAPHKGASVPLGIQGLLALAAMEQPESAFFQSSTILRPAARELLAQQYHGNQQFLELRNYLQELGWPEKNDQLCYCQW
ncbi:MAG: hypothetical protein AAF193_00605, partial [Bacteroidota bacterium]